MRKAIVALFLITAILLLSIRQERETIFIYSSMEQFRGEELQKQLNEQFPDLHEMCIRDRFTSSRIWEGLSLSVL